MGGTSVPMLLVQAAANGSKSLGTEVPPTTPPRTKTSPHNQVFLRQTSHSKPCPNRPA
ncbi:DUF6053 domain-containing protein [Lysobacter enzymogenes]|uniref:DUF6053 domain-containing protein n=1 Tax=Lysobacter enzymogenes TaxID=69 RepID=UPI003D18BFE1